MKSKTHGSVLSAEGEAQTVLTFIKDRLFFTCLAAPPAARSNVHFFTIDHVLVYQHFYADFGPLNLAQLLRFCDMLKQLLRQPELTNKRLVMYSSPAADKKANALFLLCGFMMLVGQQTPEEACQPIAAVAETIMPFRDAGYGPDTYHISILDCLQGLHKAMSLKLLRLDALDVEEYEYYEKVEHGDMNWLVHNKFLACATPHDDPQPRADPNAYPKTQQHPRNENILPHGVPWRLNDYVNYFKKNKVTTVVRLNHKVYERQRFTEQGIEHVELYFHDGSCPSMEILNAFLQVAESDRRLAVHCKAGLGRTGSLIAAYLMKHYRFTASEIIGYMRIMRPGSVVGPQQNWLASMQSTLWAMGAAAPVRSPSPVVALLPPALQNAVSSFRATVSSAMQPVVAAAAGREYVISSAGAQPAVAAAAHTLPAATLAARLAANSQQAAVSETAVPETKTTQLGDALVAVPVQPRKLIDPTMTPTSSFLAAVEQLLINSNPQLAAAPAAAGGTMFAGAESAASKAAPYNLRASTVAARSSPSSRSNSLVFDAAFTPRSRSGSNASLKLKAAAIKAGGAVAVRSAALPTAQRRKELLAGHGSS